MNKDNKAKTGCKAESVDPESNCNYDTDVLLNTRQISFQHHNTFPLPKNWSNIERLKNQRNKIQEKLLQQSFPSYFCSKKEVISRKDNVICNVKVPHEKLFENDHKQIVSSDEDCSSDSEGHLVIDDESKHSDTQLDQPVIQTPIHIHRSKSEDDATNSCLFKTKKGNRSKSTSDCTSVSEDKDLCELKVASINDSFFMAISGTEIVTNTLEDGKPVIPTIYPHAKPHNSFSVETKGKCLVLADNDSIAGNKSKDSKDTLDSEKSNKGLKKDEPKVKQITQTFTDSLKLVLPNPNKNPCKNNKRKIKPYLLSNDKKARKKLLNNEERKTFVNVTKPNESLVNQKDDVHPSPEYIILENERRSRVNKKNNNLSDQSTVSNTRKQKSINNEFITIEDKSFTSGEQLLKQELQHDISLVHQDGNHLNQINSKESKKSLNFGLSGKGAVKIKNPKCNSEVTFTSEISSNAIAVGRGHESNNSEMKNSTRAQTDTQTVGIQERIPLSSTIPSTMGSEEITSQCLNVVVATSANPIKAEIMKSLIPIDNHTSQQNADHFKVKIVNEVPLTDTLRKTDKPASAVVYTQPLQYSNSPSILIPVKPMAIQTTIGHPFALSSLPTKTMSKPHVDQKSCHSQLGKPVLLVVEKMNHVLPQSSSKFLILNPITSTQTSSLQITTMPNVLSSGQIFLSPHTKTDQSGKGLERSYKGVLQPMYNLPVLPVVSSLTAATTSEFPLTASSVCSLPTHDIHSSSCYKSPREAVSFTRRKTTSLEDNVSKISGNKVYEKNERDYKQIVSPRQSLQEICAHKKQTKKSKNNSKYMKHFKEIATWKCVENENIDPIGDSKFNKSFDNSDSVCSPQICSTQGCKSDFEMQDNDDKEYSPSSLSTCPSSQNSVSSLDSDSDESYDSIDMDRYRKIKNDKNSDKKGGRSRNNDKHFEKYTYEQNRGTLNESNEQKYEINGLPTTDKQNTELKDDSKKSLVQKNNSKLQFNCIVTECLQDSMTECLQYSVNELIGKTNRQENTQASKAGQEHDKQRNEDQQIKLKGSSKSSDKTFLTEVKGENVQTFKPTGNAYLQNNNAVNGEKNNKLRPENGQTLEPSIEPRVKKDKDISKEGKNAEVICDNEQTAIQTDPLSLRQTDPLSAMQTDPMSLMETDPVPSMQSDPASLRQTDPLSAMQTDPLSLMETDPVPSMQSDPASIIQTDPLPAMQTGPMSLMKNDPVSPMQSDPMSQLQTNDSSPKQKDPLSPKTSDKHTPDLSRARQDDIAQKRFLRTKFIILKGDICKKWLDVKKKAGFGKIPDPGFVHYLLDMVERDQEGDTKIEQTFEAAETSESREDDKTSERLSKKRYSENDRCQEENINHQNKKPKLQSPSRRQRNTSSGHSFLSRSVQKQINWAVNVFREWLKSLGDREIDFEYQSTAWLNLMLERFYKEARTIDNTLYTREDLQNLRRCLSVYLDGFPESNSVAISIQLDPGFYTSNQVLAEVVKTRQDVSPDENNCYISQEDFVKMYTSEILSDSDPVSLLWKVWFDVCFHLCNKHFPENFLISLKKHHISLLSDINGVYYTFTDSDELSLPSEESCGRMYATPDSPNRCPVRSTTVYLSKLCKSSDAFFQSPNPNWRDSQLWYRPIPLTLTKLNTIMQNISAKAKLSRIYTTSDVFATWVKYKSLKANDKEIPSEIE